MSFTAGNLHKALTWIKLHLIINCSLFFLHTFEVNIPSASRQHPMKLLLRDIPTGEIVGVIR